jgi:hypothetical protein
MLIKDYSEGKMPSALKGETPSLRPVDKSEVRK